jgi:hypothetical protein
MLFAFCRAVPAGSSWLVRIFDQVSEGDEVVANLPVTGVNVDQIIGSTDSVQFSERKIPSITIHSLTQETCNAYPSHLQGPAFRSAP